MTNETSLYACLYVRSFPRSRSYGCDRNYTAQLASS
jgi:hypothetical protein